MGRALERKSTFTPTPTVNFRGKVGSTFTGKLITSREVETAYGKKVVYEFAAIDGDAPIQLKVGDGQYADVNINAGDTVSVFASNPLHELLVGAAAGETVKIIYEGKKKSKKGVMFHSYSAEVL